MSESGKSSHWNFLAEELGAEVKPVASKPVSPPPSQPTRIRKKVEERSKPEAPKSSWNDVALALGLDVPPPAAKPPATRPAIPPAAITPTSVPAAQPPDDGARNSVAPEGSRHDRPQHDRPQRESGNRRGGRDDRGGRGGRGRGGGGRERGHGDQPPRGRSGDAVRSDRERPSDIAPSGGSPFADEPDVEFIEDIDTDLESRGEPSEGSRSTEASTGDRMAEGSGDRKSGRRRRRRRGGRSRETTASEFDGDRLPADADESPSGGDGFDTELDADESADAIPDLDRESAAQGGDELRPRRRRRRRGGRRRGGERGTRESAGGPAPESREDSDDEPHGEESDVAADFDESAEPGVEDEHDADHDQPEGHDDEHDGGDMKPSHRGIPSWEETIGVIVSTNMESRAKNPNAGGAPRGRGSGRGRGHRS